MAGTESKEREAIKKAYPGHTWQVKVLEMNDKQVQAIYLRLKKEGRI